MITLLSIVCVVFAALAVTALWALGHAVNRHEAQVSKLQERIDDAVAECNFAEIQLAICRTTIAYLKERAGERKIPAPPPRN